MRLSEQLKQDNDCGDFGNALNGYAERAEALEDALEDAKIFSAWVECLGRTDCEVYKHELKGSADLSLDRIDKALNT